MQTDKHTTGEKMKNPSKLYWNNQGRTNCSEHSPYYKSDTWLNQEWQPVPVSDETKHLKCEQCGKAMSLIVVAGEEVYA
jgi:hypothetical protein